MRINHCKSLLVVALAGSVLSACPKARPPVPPATLYERVAAKLSAMPSLAERLGKPAPELETLRWLRGTWDITAKVFATASTPESIQSGTSVITEVIGSTWLQLADSYPSGTQDLGFLTFNSVTNSWVSIGLDSTGNSVVTTAPAWIDNRLRLTGTVSIVGERVILRQTFEKKSDAEFTVLNEEQLPDGSWRALDSYHYQRRPGT